MENDKQQRIDELVDELKYYLQSEKDWETLNTEVVVDGIVESFDNNLLPDGMATYDELAKNQGVGNPPAFDDKAIELFDDIKKKMQQE